MLRQISGLLLVLLCSASAHAQSDEDRIYDLLKGDVRKTDRAFTVFHWEPRHSEFADKFQPDKLAGLLNMMRESAKSFVKKNADFGFYVATDPSESRSFGKGDWRLVQIEIPEGWRYLDVRDSWDKYLNKIEKDPQSYPPCLASILTSNNGATLKKRLAERFGNKDCSALKEKVLRRLEVQGMRYTWVVPQLPGSCNGNKDRSAYIFTDGNWLSEKNVKAYTVDTRGADPDRQAIQEIVQTQPPPTMFAGTAPAPLWPDLPKKPGLSAQTKAWMREKLLNCPKIGLVPEPTPSRFGNEEDIETASPAE